MKFTTKQITVNGKQARKATDITYRTREQPVYDKTQFLEKDDSFIKTPYALRHYTDMYPYGINTEAMWIYQLIVDWYNVEEKAAYPSQYTVARRIRKSTATVKRHITALRNVGLIKVESRGIGRSNRYIPLRPLPKEVMYERYPLAKQFAEFHDALIDSYENADKATIEGNKAKFEDKAI
ncbi:transcriptional regulator [Bacillus cereus]|nr:transcriptional regulator [Bacillus cereus]PFK27154.1 transcriptional regulator [Bacillus cereus]PFP60732.1 transcriptional regulator [Bacillus cereus]PFV18706.1 transcriptional regulator [Bacillus cereus]PGK85903.1 transcriptional regulator [Bacillus cereus]